MAGQAIIDRIDEALGSVSGLRDGSGTYAALLAEYEKVRKAKGRDAGLALLRDGVIGIAAARYRGAAGAGVELLTFEDRGVGFLFDMTFERTVLVHGFTRATAPNSRDQSYHKGAPRRDGYDKGHAFAHAQGGFEGGPNYFFQRAAVNRRLSDRGKLWRDIETHLASHAGMFAFVRLIYRRGSRDDVPHRVEYGLLNGASQFRAVVFPND